MTTCVSCLYYKAFESLGQCRRYPAPVTKSAADWCGEHTVKAYDITTDTVIKRGKNVKATERSDSSKATDTKVK
jgi:hypothetical protein